MPIRIHPISGDIVTCASEIADASALWLRNGFNERHVTWHFGIRERYPYVDPQPWAAADDQVIDLVPPDNQLKYLYVFSNPADGVGCNDTAEVAALVNRSLTTLVQLDVHRVAMIHIPLAARQHGPAAEADLESARAMVAAIREWDEANPNRISDVFLVDHDDAFAAVVPLA
jgi:hypothetical protein